jgi:hypothetical protein
MGLKRELWLLLAFKGALFLSVRWRELIVLIVARSYVPSDSPLCCGSLAFAGLFSPLFWGKGWIPSVGSGLLKRFEDSQRDRC